MFTEKQGLHPPYEPEEIPALVEACVISIKEMDTIAFGEHSMDLPDLVETVARWTGLTADTIVVNHPPPR
jgi:hypothetical protein